MISMKIGQCDIDIVPIIKGLVSEKEKVAEALSNKKYEVVALPLGIEDVEALKRRSEIEGEFEQSDVDSVYSYFLKNLGNIDMPDPAFTYLVDESKASGTPIIPLDMNDEDYSKVYCANVSTMEFLKEKRVLKKAMKTTFDYSSPEKFALQWDALMNTIKGYRTMSQIREEYIADEIKDVAKYRKSLLVLLEYERLEGTLKFLEG